MKINGSVHCFFEQSGTFKNEFKKLGINAYDYDIQNDFGETDNVVDLFAEIDNAHSGGTSVFDRITQDDLIIAFFPCIYFTGANNPLYFTLENNNYRGLDTSEKILKMIERAEKRQKFFTLIIKLVGICINKNIRLIIENPYSSLHYLHNNFFKQPDIVDNDRTKRGDYFVKPTGYWFFNCSPTYGESYQNDKERKQIRKTKSAKQAGICSTERSMISHDYARNFICDFILGKKQDFGEIDMFD